MAESSKSTPKKSTPKASAKAPKNSADQAPVSKVSRKRVSTTPKKSSSAPEPSADPPAQSLSTNPPSSTPPAKRAVSGKESDALPAHSSTGAQASSPTSASNSSQQPEASESSTTPRVITMKPPIVVKELAALMNLKPFQLIHELMNMNVFATLNQAIEEDIAKKVCEAKGFQFQLERREKGAGVHKEVEVVEVPVEEPVPDEKLQVRPPVITFMGHVDHGKTTLLDAIRSTRVAAGEAGGITQHIGAYSVEKNGQTITFLDTPGHAAFTAMRARGANITDIVVIVVAADDGLMPQTIEAINHAKAAGVTMMVAINKIDLPTANPDRVKQQLQEQGLTPEDWGGSTICVEVSATKKIGIDKLLELMLLQAEVMELKADPQGMARGRVIESQVEQGRGPVSTVLVQTGTLRVGDPFVCGTFYGKVKALINDRGQSVKSAGPSTPVKILGFNGSPTPGEEFVVMPSEREARILGEERAEAARQGKLTANKSVTLESFFADMREGEKKVLPLVIKADVQGSLEAIVESLKKIPSEKVQLDFILCGVGPISTNDVLLAKASSAIIIGFGTKVENNAASMAKRENVQIKLFSIIYELIDQIRDAMAGLLDPLERENQIGVATVKKVFVLSKFPVAGCLVNSGRISRTARARVLRRNTPIYDGGIVTLKRFQDEVQEVRAGLECGIRLGNFNDYAEGDVIECYMLEKVAQQL